MRSIKYEGCPAASECERVDEWDEDVRGLQWKEVW